MSLSSTTDGVQQPNPARNYAPSGPASSRLDSLQQYVLTGEFARQRDPDNSVQIFSASGEALECVEIARRILRLASGGMRFDEIAVFVRNAERHQPLLEEAFARAGVPAWYSRGVRRPEISGRAFLALLRCAAENLSAARFTEYLSFGRMPAEEGVSRPTSRWERILLSKASVISGLSRWESRLQAYENELNDEQVREREALESLRELALPVIHSLASLPGKADWERWLDALGDLALHTLDQPAAVHAVLDELQPMRGAGIVSLGDVLATLAPELSCRLIEENTSRYGAVFVGSLAESSGMRFTRPNLANSALPWRVAIREGAMLPNMSLNKLGRIPIALFAIATALPAQADTQFRFRRMTRNDVPPGKGQCDIRLQVDQEAEVTVRGGLVFIRTIAGRDPR